MYDLTHSLYASGCEEADTPLRLRGALARGIGRFLTRYPVVSDAVIERTLRELAEEESLGDIIALLDEHGIGFFIDVENARFASQFANYAFGNPHSEKLSALVNGTLTAEGLELLPVTVDNGGSHHPFEDYAERRVLLLSPDAALEYFAFALRPHNGGYLLHDAPEII